MRLPGYLIGFVLAVLLAVMTPVGTGAGLHQFDLLHPLFTHVHLINGRVVTHEQMEQAAASSAPRTLGPGVSFGAGDGAGAVDGGLGVSPTLPLQVVPVARMMPGRAVVADTLMPTGRPDPPPDPPPL